MKGSSRIALGAIAALSMAGTAQAQSFGRVVAFGDSYADIGNVKALLGPAFPAIYPTGRFSGGTNFVDSLASHYGATEANFAFGGAQAGSVNISSPLLPGFAQEVQLFTSGGNRFSSSDLLALSVGGNDARAYRIGGGTLANVDAATTQTARDATAGIQTLIGRGAQHVVFIAGDAGQLPEALGQANAAVGTAFSTAYNGKMQASLAAFAHNGVNIAYVDITAIGNNVRADPGRYGFSFVNTACPLTCVGNPTLQSQYFFYVDGIHLTSAAFDLVGRYAVNQLGAPYSFRTNGDLVQHAAKDFGEALTGRLDTARSGTGKDGFSVFAQFVGGHGRFDGNQSANGYSYNSTGAAGGAEWHRGGLAAGALFSWTRSHADSIDAGRAKARSYQLGGYASLDTGALFVQGYGGYGWHRLDIRRTGVMDPLTASPHATSWVLGGRAGWLARTGLGRIGPVIGVNYAHGQTDAYSETGDPAAALNVQSQRVDTVVGSAGVEVRPDFAGLSPWLRATADKNVHGDKRDVLYAPQTAPAIVNRFEIGSGSDRVYGNVAGGVSARIGQRLSIDGAAHATISRQDGNDVGGFAGIRMAL
jgi:outer membrane lipase/esterase